MQFKRDEGGNAERQFFTLPQLPAAKKSNLVGKFGIEDIESKQSEGGARKNMIINEDMYSHDDIDQEVL